MSPPRVGPSWSRDLQMDRFLIRFFWLASLIFVTVGIFYLFHHLQADRPLLWRAAMSAAFALAGLVAMVLLVRKHYVRAIQTIIWSGWVIVSSVTVVGGGIYSPNMMIYPLFIFAAGWLLSVRTGMVVAALSLLVSLGFAVAEVQGVLPAVQAVPMTISMTTTAAIIVATALCTHYFSQSYQGRFEALQKLSIDLSDSKARYERAVTGANDGIWEWTLPTGEYYLSPRFKQLLGYQDEELPNVRESLFDQIHPEDQALSEKAIREHLDERRPYGIELRMRCKGGEYRWFFSRGQATRDDNGQALRMSGSITDITARKQDEAELKQHRQHLEELVFARTAELAAARDAAETANRAKSAFLANMSHELRTPMNGIMGMTDLVLRRTIDPQQIDWLTKSKGSAKRLLAIIDDILDFSKIEAEQMILEEKDFSLSQMIDDGSRMQTEAARAKGLRLSIEIDPALPDRLCGDAARLRQILINLVGNAIKFSERGEITVHASAAEEDSYSVLLRIEVTDQGIGISPEDQRRLFHAFTQADGSFTRKHGGTGLGLIISRRLAMLMGGEIGADSTPGVGSNFWFTARLQRGHGIHLTGEAAKREIGPERAPDPSKTLAPDPARAQAVLVQLEPLLRTDDTAAGDLFETNRSVLLATLGAKGLQLGQQVAAFDYPAALATLQELIGQEPKA